MKKFLCIILTILLLMSLVACGASEDSGASNGGSYGDGLVVDGISGDSGKGGLGGLFDSIFGVPDTEVKMYYESPSFYVSAGHYLTKEEAIIEMMRFRSVFPKAIAQSREMDIMDFVVRPDEEEER